MEMPASYRALFSIRGFGRVVTATALGRLSAQMWEIVLVLFVLVRYRSPTLAGLAVLLSLLPGLLFSPVAGALLDRQGRVRLMILDYLLTATVITSIAGLSLTHRLPALLLLVLVTILSVSNILSITGARSLFPLMLPRALWDRANGLDTSSYSSMAVIGPAIAGLVVARFSPEAGLALTALVAAAAAVMLFGVTEPIERVLRPNSLVNDAWGALVYVFQHPSLRGLAITLSLINLGASVMVVGIPVLVLRQLHGTAATVGQAFALFGVAGLLTGLIIGRVNSEKRERVMIASATVIQAVVLAVLAFTSNIATLFAAALVMGGASSASNVGVFALRQRRTEAAWFGRAFAVSMSLNLAGQPIGSALSGPLLAHSITVPMLLGAGVSVVAALAALFLIPARDDDAARRRRFR
jgi:MFS family permease